MSCKISPGATHAKIKALIKDKKPDKLKTHYGRLMQKLGQLAKVKILQRDALGKS